MEFTPAEREAAEILSRADLYLFTRYMFAVRKRFRWQQNWHHRAICDALMRVFRGECRRLIINVPPRYGKTEILLNFIAWAMGQAPDSEWIYTSYSTRLAANSSWQIRDLVQLPEYRAIFPAVRLRTDSAAKDEWRTTEGGIVYAVGSEGTITGYGAGKVREGFGGAIVIDDPHKADEARSDVVRGNVIDWYGTTLASRANDPARTPIILIMQRLHEEDLSGYLLAGGSGEQWEHLCLPALQDDGTALWPAKHSVDDLRRMEKAWRVTFAGQMQQAPAPAEGIIFDPDQIGTIDAIPAGVTKWVRGWDFGSTIDGDYTAGVQLGQLPDGRILIADVVRDQWAVDERDRVFINTTHGDGYGVRVSYPQDPGQAGKSLALYLSRGIQGFTFTATPESGDKVTRAEPFAAQVNVGNVLMVRGPWNKAFKDELRMFPNGKFDDQVDGASRAYADMIAARPFAFGSA